MSDVTFVQGDTAPAVTGQILRTSSGLPRDLTYMTEVRFQMRKEDDRRHTVDAEASVTLAVEGRVEYIWEAKDLSVPGEYIAQWQMTHADGKIQTTNPPNTITIRRQ